MAKKFEIFPGTIAESLQANMPDDPMPHPEDEAAWHAWHDRHDKIVESFFQARKLARLHDALEQLDVKKRGRVKDVAEKTGYSASRVSDLLAGKVPLNDRFIMAVCSAYSINEGWMRGDDDASLQVASPLPANAIEGAGLEKLDVAIIEAIKELKKLPESERWAFVAELKRRNAQN
ncbi:helix-turn-helix transcriptional regulator [Geotalea sp. SG265]|uniref:helix-turn-helix domain-containing protein n=1 Tax=Geotalea sp. SG265 TaxID=2922867 RepID=UPI001FB016BE|nr:helix-turn-helix transcriptional regulator [Geotalea sp. SG265]